ncbi:MAG: hypothetical protein LBU70_05360 [Chitinispirillales bacterium]|nr:hypothetical protein [Chitinispirillales bacterium]
MNWIKLSDREPPLGKKVLVYGKCGVEILMLEKAFSDGTGRMWRESSNSATRLSYNWFTHWAEIVPPGTRLRSGPCPTCGQEYQDTWGDLVEEQRECSEYKPSDNNYFPGYCDNKELVTSDELVQWFKCSAGETHCLTDIDIEREAMSRVSIGGCNK